MANLHDLAKRLRGKAGAIEKEASRCAVEMAIGFVREVAYSTPVDTSQALSSWIVTIDDPTADKNPPHFRGKGGSTRNISAAETVAQARQVLATKRPGQPIYIQNNQPYIRKLNDGGHSKQPGRFLEKGLFVMRSVRANFKFNIG